MQADTIVPDPGNPQAFDRYAYGYNQPVKYTDPSGRAVECGASDNDCGGFPRSRFYCTEDYGCFDTQHMNAARVEYVREQILTQGWVRLANSFGGGQFGVAYYYDVSDNLDPDILDSVILGILMDFERRWETFQGVPFTRGWQSSFSIEDLPSDYIGFYLGFNYGTEGESFDRLEKVLYQLGGAKAVSDIPHPTILGIPFLPIRNTEFLPLVNIDGDWENVPWPQALTITPIEDSGSTWRYDGSGLCVTTPFGPVGDCRP